MCKSVIEFAGDLFGYTHTLQEALNTATLSINFAPMLAVLFIGASGCLLDGLPRFTLTLLWPCISFHKLLISRGFVNIDAFAHWRSL